MSDIDPIEFGELRAQVTALRREVDDLRSDVRALLELANRHKGAMWFGMSIASAAGGFLTYIGEKWMR